MTGTTEDKGDEAEPIDADFEPAPPRPDYVTASDDASRGPGWIALGITGVAATLFGGLIAGGLNWAGNGAYAPQTLAGEVETLSANQQAVEAGLDALRTELTGAREQMDRELSAAAAGSGDNEAVASLTAEIETLNGRLDVLQTGENDLDGLSALIDRVDMLERADESEVTSPRLANRAITALRTRVETIEEAQDQIANRQAIRAEALADLLTRMEALETAAGTQTADDIASLRSDIELLKANLAAETSTAADIQSLQETVTALREQGDADGEDALASKALFALLTMEAAAGDGRPFQSAHAQLQAALPGNETVTGLSALANQPVPTIALLQAQFDDAAVSARDAVLAAEPEADGWGWLRNVFGEDIEIRRSGADETTEDKLNTAATALDAQDLRGAVDVVKTLDGPAAAAFEGWLADAEKRLVLDESLDTLRLVLLGAER
ncbi:MAG: hypothetical protein AAFY34_02805 [Pseudomonadota bacterium]